MLLTRRTPRAGCREFRACRQNRLVSREQDIGVITTLHIDNTRRAEKAAPGTASGAARWKELAAASDSMKHAVSLGKNTRCPRCLLA